MFKLQPNIKLVLNLLDELNLGELNYQATKISWTKVTETSISFKINKESKSFRLKRINMLLLVIQMVLWDCTRLI